MSKHSVVAHLAIVVFLCLVLATVSGRWTKDRELKDNWDEVGLWGMCSCMEYTHNKCRSYSQSVNAVYGFSVIAVILEFIALLALTVEHYSQRGSRTLFLVALITLGLAVAANIITWATWAAFFRRNDMCTTGTVSYKDQGYHLEWGFGVRLVELGFLVVAIILTALNNGKAERSTLHTAAYLIVLFLFMLTVLTTSGRGWMEKRNTPTHEWHEEWGLVDACNCQQQYNNPCTEARRVVYVAEVFSVVAIFFQFLLLWFNLSGATSLVHLRFQQFSAVIGWIAQVIVIITFAEYAQDKWCNNTFILSAQRLHWAFGISCAALIIQTAIVALLGSSSVEAEPKKAASEPTA
jgi:cytochrome c biogenesis protein CcdA